MPLSLEQFAKSLTDSGIMSADDLSAFHERLHPKPTDAQGLAKELVRKKKLTKFQAQAAFKGKAKGLVFGEYVVLDKIGEGGMGAVYKAKHRRMDRVVAIKVLPPKAVDSEDGVKRFEREVKAAAKLIHPNVVAAFDAGETNGNYFLVIEYIDGQDLSKLVKENGPLTVEKAVDCTVQAARGLEYAHGEGVVHRDIKPANLLLDKKGTVKILDMGLARIDGAIEGHDPTEDRGLTQSGQVMGTVDYMSPEQCEDTKNADSRSDIYSLGCTLYRLLTGKPLYDGATMMNKMMAHANNPVPSLCDNRDDVPAELDTVFQKMVAKDAADRYQNMTEVIADLQALSSSAGSSVQGVEKSDADSALTSFVQSIGKPTTKATAKGGESTVQLDRRPVGPNKKWLLVGGGVAACLVVVGLAFAFWPGGSGEVVDDPVAVQPEAIDLLKLVDVERDALTGTWIHENGSLVSNASVGGNIILIPYEPLQEYDLTLVVTRVRQNSNNVLGIGLVRDDRGFQVNLDGLQGSGLQLISGKHYGENVTNTKQRRLELHKTSTIVCQVRESGVTVLCDDVVVINWKGSYMDLTSDPNLPDKKGLFLDAMWGYSFHSVTLTPITGQGRPLYPKESDPDRAATRKRHRFLGYELKAHPSDAVEFNGHWYKVFDEKLSWRVAQARCKEMGGYLACIEGEAENQFLNNRITQSSWIGGRRLVDSGRYFWINGERMQYKKLTGDATGDIRLTLSRNGLWTRISPTDSTYPFICEWDH